MLKLQLFITSILTISCTQPGNKQYAYNYNTNSTEATQYTTQTGYKVIGVKDGDTVVILVSGGSLTVRLADVDCPEKKQPFGNVAKQYVANACYGKFITLEHKGKYDRNKRLIATVILPNGDNLNRLLVSKGLAWHFVKYSKDESYAMLQEQAMQSRVGLWSLPNPVPPWVWRK